MNHIDSSREWLQKKIPDTMLAALGIELTRMDPDCVEGKMPVDRRTHQPMGLLHGGASVALAESLASIGANLAVDPKRFFGVGLEINANHIKSVESGWVYGRAVPMHMGKKTQVWSIEIRDGAGNLLCISRCTIAILERKA